MSQRHASWTSGRASSPWAGTRRPADRAPLLDLEAMVGLPRAAPSRPDDEREQADENVTELAARLTQLFR